LFSGRSGHTTVITSDGTLVLAGGRASNNYYTDIWKSVDDGSTWSLISFIAESSGKLSC
jgi:hypothetical protein